MFIVGKIGHHKNHPERWCLMFPNGEPSNYYPRGWTRDQVVAELDSLGFVVMSDNTITRPEA